MTEVVPYILEDRTADALSTSFIDLEGRLRLDVVPTRQDRTTVFVTDAARGGGGAGVLPAWEAMLTFGPAGALGNVHLVGRAAVRMVDYLRPIRGAQYNRAFRASDGHEYAWCYRVSQHENEEWTCYDRNNAEIADYSLPIENESYGSSSGCTLTIVLSARAIAAELLTALTIMRHIKQHNL